MSSAEEEPKESKKKISKKLDKDLLEIGEHLFSQIAMQLVRDEIISPKGKTEEQVRAEILKEIEARFIGKNLEVFFWIDHADDLLAEARLLLRQDKIERSALHFSTYFEHHINWLIVQLGHKKHLDDATIRQLLREASVKAKCTWVLRLLGHEPVKSDILRAIEDIGEIRNAFIHYKWPSEPADDPDSEKKREQRRTKLKKAETIVRYLRRFEDRKVLMGQGQRVRSILKIHSPRKHKIAED